MPVGVLGLLLAAALLHAGWNILLKTSDDPLRTAGRGMVVGAAVLIPAAFVGWLTVGRPPIPTEAWALAILSGVLEAGYFVLLSAAYRRGDLSLVYPIARGTAPVLAVGGGVVFLGERLGPLGTLGVALLLAGILALQRPWAVFRRGGALPRNVREAAWLAVATGVTIACYSGVDRIGARLIAPWLYAALIWTFGATFLVGWIALVDRRGRRAAARAIGSAAAVAAVVETETMEMAEALGPELDPAVGPPGWTRPAIGGLVTVGAYLLVLVAYVYAPLSAVAPVRESAIVLVSGWGAFRLGEATGRRRAALRIGAASVILVGAFLLALER
jgi:drug/metabolite transporter (DMT)-like permease